MNMLHEVPTWAVIAVSLLLVIGGSVVFIGALGLLRLPSFYQRIHGPAISITLGAGCLLLASMIYFSALQERIVIHEIVISLFIMMTAPVVSMLLMRAAVYRDLRAGSTDIGDPEGLFGLRSNPDPDATKAPNQAPAPNPPSTRARSDS